MANTKDSLKVLVLTAVVNRPDVTEKFLGLLDLHSTTHPQVLVVDNGSDPKWVWPNGFADKGYELHEVRHARNMGIHRALQDSLKMIDCGDVQGDIIAFLHNDLFLLEPGWDQKVADAFAEDPKLGLVGVFGARGCGKDGGRSYCYGHFMGEVDGGCKCHEFAWQHHGTLCPPEGIPAAVLDGCAMIFRADALRDVGVAMDYPIHHFYDRLYCCRMLDKGWHIRVLDIRCDHGNGATAITQHEAYQQRAIELAIEAGEDVGDRNGDQVTYDWACRKWTEEWGDRMPVWVDRGYGVHWRSNPPGP